MGGMCGCLARMACCTKMAAVRSLTTTQALHFHLILTEGASAG